jgi:hypothetical protein
MGGASCRWNYLLVDIQIEPVDSLGKNLVVMGLLLAAVGVVLWVWGRHGGGFLAGDIVVEKKNFRFYFPVVTCLVVSLVLSAIAWLLRR